MRRCSLKTENRRSMSDSILVPPDLTMEVSTARFYRWLQTPPHLQIRRWRSPLRASTAGRRHRRSSRSGGKDLHCELLPLVADTAAPPDPAVEISTARFHRWSPAQSRSLDLAVYRAIGTRLGCGFITFYSELILPRVTIY